MTGTTSSGEARGRPSLSPGAGKRNFLLGIANGALVRVGLGFTNPNLVLAGFIYHQTTSTFLVGLLATVSALGQFWPQLYMSSLIEHRTRKKPFYIGASVFRASMLLAMSASMWMSGRTDSSWPLVVFFVMCFLFRTGQGAGRVPFFDLIGQSITPGRLGGFFALRAFCGDALNVVCAFLVVQPIIDDVPAPGNYALLAAIAVVLMGSGWGMWFFAEERANDNPPRKRSFAQALAGGFQTMRTDRNYRILVVMRVLTRFNFLAVVFFVPYGVERLGAVGMGGAYVGVRSASRLVSSLLWGKVSNEKGNRICLIGSGLLFALCPIVALIAARLPEVFSVSVPILSVPLDLPLSVYLLALCIFGLAMQANMIARNAFVLEIAPPHRRPTYIAFMETVIFPLTVLPMVVGAIVGKDVARLDIVFAVIAVSGLLTFVAAFQLREVRGAAAEAA